MKFNTQDFSQFEYLHKTLLKHTLFEIVFKLLYDVTIALELKLDTFDYPFIFH